MVADDQRSGIEEVEMVSPGLKIGPLVVGHVVAGFLLAWADQGNGSGNSPAFVGLFGLVFAQACLLGIWGALGTTRPTWRLPAVLATTGYLCALVITAERGWRVEYLLVELSLHIALPTLAIFVLLSILRHSRQTVHFVRQSSLSPRGGQFTIRQLLLATTAIAILLAIGREVRGVSESYWMVKEGLVLTCVTLGLIAVAIAVLWGALGIKRPTPRLAIVLPSAFVVGALPTFYLETLLKLDWEDYATWSCIVGLQAIVTAASLLVFRSCGWRLVRGSDTDEQMDEPTPPGS